MGQPSLETRWLMTLSGTIPQPTVIGSLWVFNVVEARMDGPRIKATMAAPTGDWIRVQPNGNWKLDVRMLMVTDDGEPIYCHYNGVVRMTPKLIERIGAGESIDGSEIYFRSAPYFETVSPKYAWLNDILCIGKVATFGGGQVRYDIFEVL